MQQWQNDYINNVKTIRQLSIIQSAVNPIQMKQNFIAANEQCRQLAIINGQLLSDHLFTLFDSINRLSEEQINDIKEFTKVLESREVFDNGLALYIHQCLLTYYRNKKDRDNMIKELYYCGLRNYYLTNCFSPDAVPSSYHRRTRLYFQEAASYHRIIDDIEDTEVRGFIYRAIGNIPLSYRQNTGYERLNSINTALKVVQDPVNQAKTPDLPWNSYIYTLHQNRTTLLTLLRAQETTPQVTQEVMESNQYIQNIQEERARATNTALSARYMHTYLQSLYFTGIDDAQTFLNKTIDLYNSVSSDDYSSNGCYVRCQLPAYFMNSLHNFLSSQAESYAPQANKMLLEAIEYLEKALLIIDNNTVYQLSARLFDGFIELPDGMKFVDFYNRLVPIISPVIYVHSYTTAKTAQYLMNLCLRYRPDLVASLNLSKEDCLTITYESALLHDCGLCYYPSGYVVCIRPLLRDEENLLNYHSSIGANLVEGFKSTKRCFDIVLGHHYNQDSTILPLGYDRDKDTMPVITDIVSLCDALSDQTCGINNRLQEPVTIKQALTSMSNSTYYNKELLALLTDHFDEFYTYINDVDSQLWTKMWLLYYHKENQ